MAKDEPPKDLMQYDAMAQEALRGVVRGALKKVAADGLPGEHHFYITFRTRAAGVSCPKDLLARYPDDMTIVIKPTQYRDLAPGETFFSVTLAFGGQPRTLSIPYAAVTRFYDPSVRFSLQFEASEDAPPAQSEAPEPVADIERPASDAKVVSLDQFRKK